MLYPLFKKLRRSRVLLPAREKKVGAYSGRGLHMSAASYSTKWVIRGRWFEVV